MRAWISEAVRIGWVRVHHFTSTDKLSNPNGGKFGGTSRRKMVDFGEAPPEPKYHSTLYRQTLEDCNYKCDN
jgi:hypothetical protein